MTSYVTTGYKISIALEELKEAYGKPSYVVQSIPLPEGAQKEAWFTELGPNARIPVLVDRDNDGLGWCSRRAFGSHVELMLTSVIT